MIAAIETRRKTGSVRTWQKLGFALAVSWEQLTEGLVGFGKRHRLSLRGLKIKSLIDEGRR